MYISTLIFSALRTCASVKKHYHIKLQCKITDKIIEINIPALKGSIRTSASAHSCLTMLRPSFFFISIAIERFPRPCLSRSNAWGCEQKVFFLLNWQRSFIHLFRNKQGCQLVIDNFYQWCGLTIYIPSMIIVFHRNSCSLTHKSADNYTSNCLQENTLTLLSFEQNKRVSSKFNCFEIQNIPYQFWSLWLQNQIKSFHRKAQELGQQIQSPSHLARPSTMNIIIQ